MTWTSIKSSSTGTTAVLPTKKLASVAVYDAAVKTVWSRDWLFLNHILKGPKTWNVYEEMKAKPNLSTVIYPEKGIWNIEQTFTPIFQAKSWAYAVAHCSSSQCNIESEYRSLCYILSCKGHTTSIHADQGSSHPRTGIFTNDKSTLSATI